MKMERNQRIYYFHDLFVIISIIVSLNLYEIILERIYEVSKWFKINFLKIFEPFFLIILIF